mgnify:CR=1 FL=1
MSSIILFIKFPFFYYENKVLNNSIFKIIFDVKIII